MWFNSLLLLEQITFIVAIIGSSFLLLKIILLIAGISDITDIMFGLGRGFVVMIFQGLICLMAIGGWVMFGTSRAGLPWWAALLIGIAASLVGMTIILILYKMASKLEADGTLEMEKGVGKIGEVYLLIPASTDGHGKVNVTIANRIVEVNAVTKSESSIKTGENVKIVSYENGMYVVEKA